MRWVGCLCCHLKEKCILFTRFLEYLCTPIHYVEFWCNNITGSFPLAKRLEQIRLHCWDGLLLCVWVKKNYKRMLAVALVIDFIQLLMFALRFISSKDPTIHSCPPVEDIFFLLISLLLYIRIFIVTWPRLEEFYLIIFCHSFLILGTWQ